jgi:cellulose biosynthesis protein BcsQ
MEAGENKPAEAPEADDSAKDVARLYSLAQVEDVPYHRFSRQRRPQTHPPALSEVRQSNPLAARSVAPAQDAEAEVEPSVASTQTQRGISFAASQTLAANHPATPRQTPHIDVPQTTFPQPGSASHDRPRGVSLKPGLPQGEDKPTSMAVYSLAGGVGKTTITANLGRILCSLGEQVLLVDASGSGLLPFYFGASDLRPCLRTFVAPETNYPPMNVIGADDITPEWLENDVKAAMKMVQRTIFDLGPASMAMLPQVLEMCAVLLVPLLSDLNSMLTVSRIEASVKAMQSKRIRAPLPFYVFNKFDERNSMDQEARNLVVRQCDERLLPITIRRSADVTAAICDRMTVADHAAESEVTHDFLEVAMWLRKVMPIRRTAKSPGRWSER